MRCRDELREPLLSNGTHEDGDVEAGPPPKVPPPPPSSSADSDDEAEIEEEGYLARLAHLWSSPLVATACCIFLCYILKVVQQVGDSRIPRIRRKTEEPSVTGTEGSSVRNSMCQQSTA